MNTYAFRHGLLPFCASHLPQLQGSSEIIEALGYHAYLTAASENMIRINSFDACNQHFLSSVGNGGDDMWGRLEFRNRHKYSQF